MGSVVAAPIIASIYIAYGWQATFVGIGVLGFLWVIPWLIINRDTPDRHPWITHEEQKHILESAKHQPALAVKAYSWKQLLAFKTTWGLISARFFIDPVWWMFVTWFPTFLKEQYHFDIKQVGAFAWVPFLFAALGGLTGGFFAAQRMGKGVAAHKARKQAITIGSVIMLLSLGGIAFYLNELRDHVNITLALISATLFGFQFLINNMQTLPADYFHGKNVGTVAGMGGTTAVIGTMVVTSLVPTLTRYGYVPFFVLGAVLVPLSWLCITFMYNRKNENMTAAT